MRGQALASIHPTLSSFPSVLPKHEAPGSDSRLEALELTVCPHDTAWGQNPASPGLENLRLFQGGKPENSVVHFCVNFFNCHLRFLSRLEPEGHFHPFVFCCPPVFLIPKRPRGVSIGRTNCFFSACCLLQNNSSFLVISSSHVFQDPATSFPILPHEQKVTRSIEWSQKSTSMDSERSREPAAPKI